MSAPTVEQLLAVIRKAHDAAEYVLVTQGTFRRWPRSESEREDALKDLDAVNDELKAYADSLHPQSSNS